MTLRKHSRMKAVFTTTYLLLIHEHKMVINCRIVQMTPVVSSIEYTVISISVSDGNKQPSHHNKA